MILHRIYIYTYFFFFTFLFSNFGIDVIHSPWVSFFPCPRAYILGNVDDFRAVELYAVNYVVWRLLVLWSSWSNREFHEEKGGTRAGSRASQGVNYARKQYYRTNYRTGERNSVKCRAAHYQPLPRECTPRYKLFRRMANWPDSKGNHCPFFSFFSFFPLFLFLLFFSIFLILFPFFPFSTRFCRFIRWIGDEALTEIFNRLENFFSIVGTCALLPSKSNQVVLPTWYFLLSKYRETSAFSVWFWAWIND